MLTQISPATLTGHAAFKCHCGLVVRLSLEASSHIHDCGHTVRILAPSKYYTSGANPLYVLWCQMLRSCSDPMHYTFSRNGGRGIKVCVRWQRFQAFEQDMRDTFPPKTTVGYFDKDHELFLIRLDPSKNYELENCRWATPRERAGRRNRRMDTGEQATDANEPGTVRQKVATVLDIKI